MEGCCGNLSYEKKLKLRVQTHLLTTMNTKFSRRTNNTYLPKISLVMMNKSTDMQMHNECE